MPISEEIDELIEKQYETMTSTSGNGELAQLSRLFSKDFVDGLAKIIYKGVPVNSKIIKTVTVELSYIDKQPYARYLDSNNIVVHGELADALFIYRDGWGSLDKTGEIIPKGRTNDRAIFFQAKVNTSNKIPTVPIRTGKSTDKEYKLLSQWKEFDLVKKPANRTALINSVNIYTRNKNILSHGWFGACAPTHQKVWDSRWMCGEANKGTPCLTTLGMLLASLYQCEEINGIEIGRCFDSQKEIVNQQSEWDDLVNTVVKLSKESESPSVLASYSSTRHRSSTTHLNLDELDDTAIDYLAKFICDYFLYNYNRCFYYHHKLSMIWKMYFRKTNSIKEMLDFHKFIIDITESALDEIESKKSSIEFSDIVNIVEILIRTSTHNTHDNDLYNISTSDHKFNVNKNGMFILTVTILKTEGQML